MQKRRGGSLGVVLGRASVLFSYPSVRANENGSCASWALGLPRAGRFFWAHELGSMNECVAHSKSTERGECARSILGVANAKLFAPAKSSDIGVEPKDPGIRFLPAVRPSPIGDDNGP